MPATADLIVTNPAGSNMFLGDGIAQDALLARVRELTRGWAI